MSSEVGSGQVAIFPTFRGFRRAVSREVDGVASAAAQGFRRTFGAAGSRAGQDTGKGFRQAFSRQADGVGRDVLSKLTDDVAKASRSLSQARLRELDAAGKVRVAEARLAEAREKGGEGSARAIAAEEALAAAQRRLGETQLVTATRTDALTRAKAELAAASVVLERQTRAASGSLGGFFRNVRDGFRDLGAAGSAFTGIGGTVGGFARILVGPVEGALRAAAMALAGGRRLISASVDRLWLPLGQRAQSLFDSIALRGLYTLDAATSAVSRFTAPLRSSIETVALRSMLALDRVSATASRVGASIAGPVRSALDTLGLRALYAVDQASATASLIAGGIRRPVVAALDDIASQALLVREALRQPFLAFRDGFRGVSTDAVGFSRLMADLGSVVNRAVVPARLFASNFRDGLRDANAAASAFTGFAGTLGGATAVVGRFGARVGAVARTATSGITSVGLRAAGAVQSAASAVVAQARTSASAVLNHFAPVGGLVSKALSHAQAGSRVAFQGIGAAAGLAARGVTSAFSVAGSGIAAVFPAVWAGIQRGASVAAAAVQRSFRVAGLAIAGVLTASLVTGFNRLVAIENAQAKLRGLGNDARTVEQIMKDANAAVLGTAFGLDEAATIAASAVAAGIKPGMELEKYLRLTADAATIAGVPLNEMGAILNKTTASGRAYTEQLQQLEERGIPIFTWLAEEMGVSQDALRKMVTEGKVDSETYLRVISQNIGGAALESGKTTVGSFNNMRAAAGRFGVALQSELFPILAPLFNTISSGFGAAQAAVTPFVEQITGPFEQQVLPALERARELFQSFREGSIGGSELFSGLAEALPVLQGLLTVFDWFRVNVAPIFEEQVLPVLREVGAVLSEELQSALAEIAPQLPSIVQAFADLIVAIAPLLPQLVPLIPPLVELAVSILPPLVDLLGAAMPAAIGLLGIALGLIVPPLTFGAQFVSGFYDALHILWQFVTGQFSLADVGREARSIEGPFRSVIDFAVTLGQTLQRIPEIVSSALSGAGTWLVESGRALIQGFIDGIGDMVTEAGNAASRVVSSVLDFFPNSPAKKGPLSGTGWRRVSRSGSAIVDQLADGIERESHRKQTVTAAAIDRMVGRGAEVEFALARATSGTAMAVGAAASSAGADAPSGGVDLRGAQITSVDVPGTIRALQTESARARARHGGRVVTG